MKNIFVFLLLISINASAQQEFNFDTTFFFYNKNNQPDINWNKTDFEPSSDWTKTQIKSLGFGTTVDSVIESCKTLYVRWNFEIENINTITEAMLFVNFDDGFVAYINGTEVARMNMGNHNSPTNYEQSAVRSNEFNRGSETYNRQLGFFIDNDIIKNTMRQGRNTLSIEVHDNINDTINDLAFYAYMVDLSKTPFDIHGWSWFGYRQTDLQKSNLPIMKIELPNGIFATNKKKCSATMQIFDNVEGEASVNNEPTYIGNIGIDVRGQSSSNWAKRNYGIETRDENNENMETEILGFPKDNDWVLHGPYADRSLIRNALAYTLGRKLPDYSPRCKFVDLIINDEYMGVYLLTEKIKRGKNRIDIKKLTNESTNITGGYIMKWDKINNDNGSWQIIYPAPEQITPEQKEYITNFYKTEFVQTALSAKNLLDPEKGYRHYIARPSFIDYTILNEIPKNPDGYKFSTYMYKDVDNKGKKLHYGPIWDYDLAFGNCTFQNGNKNNGWQFANKSGSLTNPRLYHTYLFQDTTLTKEFAKRWHELRKQKFSDDSIMFLIDSLRLAIGKGVERNFEVWPIEGKYMNAWGFSFAYTYEEEIQKLKSWISNRLAWIDANIDDIYYPYKAPTIINDNQILECKTYPNPTTNYVNIEGQLKENSNIQIEIINQLGQTLITQNTSSNNNEFAITLDLTALNQGMYYINIYTNKMLIASNTIVKQ